MFYNIKINTASQLRDDDFVSNRMRLHLTLFDTFRLSVRLTGFSDLVVLRICINFVNLKEKKEAIRPFWAVWSLHWKNPDNLFKIT